MEGPNKSRTRHCQTGLSHSAAARLDFRVGVVCRSTQCLIRSMERFLVTETVLLRAGGYRVSRRKRGLGLFDAGLNQCLPVEMRNG